MEIRKLEVPFGVKYISQWSEYHLPKGEHCIVDKGITGCGYTEYCLTNNENVVLCSPRRLLLENKAEQHKDDENILYLKNEIKDFDGEKGVKKFKSKISDHIFKCQNFESPVKFLVTYDSLHYVVDYLSFLGLLDDFVFVVDEFQAIFNDAFFKAGVEFDFVQVLQKCPSVIYLSATPMLNEYLCEVPEFRDLPFYKLDWTRSGYVESIKIKRKKVRSLHEELVRIVNKFEMEEYETLINENGEVVESKEAVLYFNSVTEIVRAANKLGLTPENTIIICADTPENRKKLKRIGFKPGKVPVKGEKNPKYMLCTATSYFGVDFHSSCASSFVFADPNIDSLALDISLDLPQIVGRQRDRENPFKNTITLIYKTTKKDIPFEEFQEKQEQRRESTKNLLDLYNLAQTEEQKGDYLRKLKESIDSTQYSFDFVGVSKETNLPVYNKFIELADLRAWKISQEEYQDSIMVTRALQKAGYDENAKENPIVKSFLEELNTTPAYNERLKMYCEFMDDPNISGEVKNILIDRVPDPSLQKYYSFYGGAGCKSKMYAKSLLELGIKDAMKEGDIFNEILKEFETGESYTKKMIKLKLQKIYKSLDINRKAKATDILNYFETSRIRINGSEGFELINLL